VNNEAKRPDTLADWCARATGIIDGLEGALGAARALGPPPIHDVDAAAAAPDLAALFRRCKFDPESPVPGKAKGEELAGVAGRTIPEVLSTLYPGVQTALTAALAAGGNDAAGPLVSTAGLTCIFLATAGALPDTAPVVAVERDTLPEGHPLCDRLPEAVCYRQADVRRGHPATIILGAPAPRVPTLTGITPDYRPLPFYPLADVLARTKEWWTAQTLAAQTAEANRRERERQARAAADPHAKFAETQAKLADLERHTTRAIAAAHKAYATEGKK
jgi:hypothetical protein